jgi:hypothetical protein
MHLRIEQDRAVLAAQMSAALARVLPRLEGQRSWLKAGGLSVEPTEHNLSVLSEAFPSLEIERTTEPTAAEQEWDYGSPGTTLAYTPRTSPYDHQVAALEKARSCRHFALFMEQGTGKTKVAIDRAGELFCDGQITGVLVVAPKGVHRQWADSQIPTHCGVDHEAQSWPIKGDLPDSLKPGAGLKFLTINIDGIKTKAGKAIAHAFMAAHRGRVMMIVDESQTIKSHSSERWKAANELGRLASHRMILTGTPIAKDLTEEWAQFKWLDESIIGIRYITAFRNEYCIMGGFEGRQIIGHKNLERFRARVDPYSFRATKDDIGILPKAYDEWAFDLTEDQRRQMQDMKKLFLSQIASGEIATAQNGAVALLRLQQIANGFLADEDGKLHRLMAPKDNPRIQALMEFLEATEGKVVIWARFREDIKQIAEMLGEDCVTYYGSTSDKDRKTSIEAFLSPDGPRYFVSNPQAGGVGLNLQGACERAVYYSNSENSIDRWQSEDRIHRIGTSGHVIYTDLIAERSPDRKIINNIKRKKSVSDMALDEIKSIMEDI